MPGSGQIFERTKTCTDPHFVYAGSVDARNFLNGKICKFFNMIRAVSKDGYV